MCLVFVFCQSTVIVVSFIKEWAFEKQVATLFDTVLYDDIPRLCEKKHEFKT